MNCWGVVLRYRVGPVGRRSREELLVVMVIAAASVVVAGAVAKDERVLQVGIDDGIDVVGRSAAMDADGHLLKELDGAGPPVRHRSRP